MLLWRTVYMERKRDIVAGTRSFSRCYKVRIKLVCKYLCKGNTCCTSCSFIVQKSVEYDV